MVIGDPVTHSLSPAIHNAAFAALGIDATFEAVTVAAGEAGSAVDRMRAEPWLGMSVTMPHKADVVGYLDATTDVASSLGAVNCVFWEGDRLIGDNTDGAGVIWSLGRLGVPLEGRTVAVLGAGGAARACIAALAAAGVTEVLVVNRTAARAVEAASLAPTIATVAAPDRLPEADIVVNATPMGMAGADAGGAPVYVPGPGCVALDLVYHPLRTAWMDRAERNGALVANGVGMLVGQAAVAFERWTGRAAPTDVMWDAVSDRLGDA